MSDPTEDFVRAGIARYVEAQQTIIFFRQKVFDQLERAFRQTLLDGPCMLVDEPDMRRSTGGGSSEWWLALMTSASIELSGKAHPARIEVGVWWNPTGDQDRAPCVVYANLRDVDAALAKFAPDP